MLIKSFIEYFFSVVLFLELLNCFLYDISGTELLIVYM